MTQESNKEIVSRQLQLSWNEGKFEQLRDSVLPDFYYKTTFTDDILNLEQYIYFIQMFRDAMPDLSVDLEEIMSEGDRVMSYVSFSGAVTKPLLKIPASDKIIMFPAVSFWTIKQDKIANLETMIDISGVERQLGVNLSSESALRNMLE